MGNDLLERARDLRSTIAANAEANDGQPMPKATVDLCQDAGFYGAMIPRDLGGSELTLGGCLDVFAEVARADGSTGWCVMASSMATAYFGAWCSDEFVNEMFADGVPITAGQFAPNGTAVPTDDGFTFTGDYNFGSGIEYATWVGAGAFTQVPEGEAADYRFAVMPKDKATVKGNWDVLGLEGTASYDYSIDGVDIPERATFSFFATNRKRGGPIYDLGVLPLTSLGHAGWAIGVVQRALDEVKAIAKVKQRMSGSSKMVDDPRFRFDLGHMESRFRSAERWCRESFDAIERTIIETGETDPALATEVQQSTTFLTQEGADIVRQAYLHAGTTGLREGGLNRCFRDIHAGSQHAMVSPAHTLAFGDQLLAAAPDSALEA